MTNSTKSNHTSASTTPIMRRGQSANESDADPIAHKPNASKNKQTKWVQIRLFPIWLRVIIIFALLIIAIGTGLTVGYSVLGDGESSEVLKWSTWQHLIDIIKGKE